MPDAYGNPTEEEMRRQVGYAPPPVLGNSAPGWSGTIGGTRMSLGGLNAGASQADAEAFYRNSTAYNRSAGGGYLTPEAFSALNQGASADELSAYGDTYDARQRQQNQGKGGVGDSIVNSVKFEADRFGNLVKAVADDPTRAFTGSDPIGTKFNNALFGTDNKPLFNQLGGATESDFNRYAQGRDATDMRGVRPTSSTANYVAGFAGGAGAANGIGNLFGNAGQGVQLTTSNGVDGLSSALPEGLLGSQGALPEIVVTGTAQGSGAGVGALGGAGWNATEDPMKSFRNAQTGGNAGQLAQDGGISGGAGTGLWGSIDGSGILSAESLGNIQQLSGLLGGGKDQGSQTIPFMQPVLGNQQAPQQAPDARPLIGMPQQQMPYIPTRGYRARKFQGATIWS